MSACASTWTRPTGPCLRTHQSRLIPALMDPSSRGRGASPLGHGLKDRVRDGVVAACKRAQLKSDLAWNWSD